MPKDSTTSGKVEAKGGLNDDDRNAIVWKHSIQASSRLRWAIARAIPEKLASVTLNSVKMENEFAFTLVSPNSNVNATGVIARLVRRVFAQRNTERC